MPLPAEKLNFLLEATKDLEKKNLELENCRGEELIDTNDL